MQCRYRQIIVLYLRCDCCFGGCGDLRAAFEAEVFGPLFRCVEANAFHVKLFITRMTPDAPSTLATLAELTMGLISHQATG